MRHLGWRFVADPAATEIRAVEGRPCDRPTLAAAQEGGDLKVVFPAGVTDAAVAAWAVNLPTLLHGIASRCAYQQRIAVAVEKGCRKLAANADRGQFTFPKFVLIDSPWFSMEAPKDAWVKQEKLYVARGKPAVAVEAFYDREVVAECYVGQTIGVFATQYELYGRDAFDQAFRPDEITIGNVDPNNESPIGSTMTSPHTYPWRGLFIQPHDQDEWGLVLARLGPKAFAGLTGIVRDIRDIDGANENFVFVSVSERAVQSILAKGGLKWSYDAAQEARDLFRARRRTGLRGDQLVEMERRIKEIDADPIYTEILMYVHPYGIVPLGELVVKKRWKNGVAVAPMLYASARDDFFFQRYKDTWKALWAKGQAPQ
jgi:hypothetical protein